MNELYLPLKALHVTCVVLSGTGFALRGLGMLCNARWLHTRLARRLPHLIDTVLLASALGLAALSGQYPFLQPWLTAKFFALIGYIVLGTLALKPGRSKAVRSLAFGLALTVYGYLVGVAVTRDPMLGGFSWMDA